MNTRIALVAVCALLGTFRSHAADTNEKHLLYVAAPGIRNYLEYGGHGLVVFDMDAGHKFVKRIAPKLVESVKWGNGCWLKEKAFVSYVYSTPEYVQFGFVRGSSLKDPKKLLEGEAQYVRHIKVHKVKDIDETAFTALLRQAIR